MSDRKRAVRKRIPRELAVINADRCTGCGACIEVCPVDCIALVQQHPESPALQTFCEVDWDRCIGCRLCVQIPVKKADRYDLLVCPWDAIAMIPPDGLAAAVNEIGGPNWYTQSNRERLLAAAQRQKKA
jgi:electron transport complex protein RnfB